MVAECVQTVEGLIRLGCQQLDDEQALAYFPPTDPVVIGQEVVGGFSATSMGLLVVEGSSLDDRPGDEAIADAVRSELHADAATCGLEIEVNVEDCVAYLRGQVADVQDVDVAEEVAGRLPQVVEVIEELVIAGYVPLGGR